MKLTTITHVSVDGVMQGLGSPDEDRRGGFKRGGWSLPLFEGEASTILDQIFQRADAFLLGRRTYEIFAGSWGTWADPGDSPIWTALNTKPKYVASSTLTRPRWVNTTVLSGDLAATLRELKAKRGEELQVHGSGKLIRWLLDSELVNEFTLFTYPLIIGEGTRLLPDTGPDIALELIDSRATPSGITIQVYRPSGRPRYAKG
jgi:dihydrofolate reductase